MTEDAAGVLGREGAAGGLRAEGQPPGDQLGDGDRGGGAHGEAGIQQVADDVVTDAEGAGDEHADGREPDGADRGMPERIDGKTPVGVFDEEQPSTHHGRENPGADPHDRERRKHLQTGEIARWNLEQRTVPEQRRVHAGRNCG